MIRNERRALAYRWRRLRPGPLRDRVWRQWERVVRAEWERKRGVTL